MMILDYNDKRPIYEQIVDRFISLILKGVYEADAKLPSVRSLAIDLSINPNTIQRAYGELERLGYIYSVKGRGNFVRNTHDLALKEKEKLMDELAGQLRRCREIGIPASLIRETMGKIYREGEDKAYD